MFISVVTPTIRTDGLKVVQESLRGQTFKDFEWLVDVGYGKHDLNQSYNRMIRRAKGDIFVSIQDYTKIQPDFLEKVAKAYKPDTFFTVPVGKTTNWEQLEWDWRKHRDDCTWNEWEIDCGFCPMEALWRIGGFDEELDKKWSFDNVSVGYRAEQFGYKFGVVRSTEAIAYDHDKTIEHPFRKDYDSKFWNSRLDSYQFEPKLPYLTR